MLVWHVHSSMRMRRIFEGLPGIGTLTCFKLRSANRFETRDTSCEAVLLARVRIPFAYLLAAGFPVATAWALRRGARVTPYAQSCILWQVREAWQWWWALLPVLDWSGSDFVPVNRPERSPRNA